LPADAVPAVFAYSLNRKLRKLYSGEYFRYRQASGGEFDYPSNTPNLTEDVFITTIYDQAVGYGVQHAVQANQSLQPKLELVGSNYRAVFNQQEYLDVPSSGESSAFPLPTEPNSTNLNFPNRFYFQETVEAIALVTNNKLTAGQVYDVPYLDFLSQTNPGDPRVINSVRLGNHFQLMNFRGIRWEFLRSGVSELGQDFTITAIGDGGDFPRPMIGIWGTTDRITVEPSDQATRFTFNNNLGTILDQDGRVTQCRSGYDPKQNNHRVLTIKTGSSHGHITTTSQTPTFSNISIGREDQRLYKGAFTEVTMHLGNLTELGSDQLFQTTRTYYGD
jgi:hypothetical protein